MAILTQVIQVLLLCALTITSFAQTQLVHVQTQQQANKTIIRCTLTGTFVHKAFILHQPERIVVDLVQTVAGPSLRSLHIRQGIITGFRHGNPNPKTLRLVFEVKQPVSLTTTTWQPAGKQMGLQLNILPKSPITTAITSTPQFKSNHALPVRVKYEPPRSLRDVVVVIDPGHGGKDPGAIGMRRSKEKHVVLAIALKLKQLIDRQPGMRAVLTRNGDYYVGLRQRLNIARKYDADIFVAIHADAFANHHSNGASVFALSQRGATSEAARWLAEKENNSELGGVNLADLDDQNGMVRTVLLDLSQTATISASLKMGDRLLRNLDRMTSLHNNKVEQARFVVLKSPDIPSVLIETGFISNPREEANLTNPAYQTRLSQAIFTGLKGYFWDNPPHGSRIEAMSGINRRLAQK